MGEEEYHFSCSLGGREKEGESKGVREWMSEGVDITFYSTRGGFLFGFLKFSEQ